MAESKQEKSSVERVAGEAAEEFVKLLDPHLQEASRETKLAGPQRWSMRKTLLFAVSASLILWIAVFAMIYFLSP